MLQKKRQWQKALELFEDFKSTGAGHRNHFCSMITWRAKDIAGLYVGVGVYIIIIMYIICIYIYISSI